VRPVVEVELDATKARVLRMLARPRRSTWGGDVAPVRYTCGTCSLGVVNVVASTSFRISEAAKQGLAARAELEGVSATALLDRLILEGIAVLDFPGIVFRGPGHDRRAGLAAGPDVWEIVARLQELKGSEERRITVLSEESEVHPRLIRLALDYASAHSDEILERMGRQRDAVARSRSTVAERTALLAA
jgi:hypothetical protein